MPGRRHQLSTDLKSAMRRQTILPHGFQRDQSAGETRASIESAVEVLSRHRPAAWHIVLVSAYTGFNYGRGIVSLWRYIQEVETDEERRVVMGAQMREGILKCVPFLGVPRVLNCLGCLHTAQGREMGARISALLDPLRDDMKPSHGSSIGTEEEAQSTTTCTTQGRDTTTTTMTTMMAHGRALWDDVYAPAAISQKLLDKITTLHPNLSDVIVASHYGHALSPTAVVSREDTSAIAVTVLRVEEDVLDQLTSHVYGLLKGGGDEAYCRAIIAVVDGLRSGNMASVKSQL